MAQAAPGPRPLAPLRRPPGHPRHLTRDDRKEVTTCNHRARTPSNAELQRGHRPKNSDCNTGIFVEYPGANVSNALGQANPYTTRATNPQVTTFAQQLLTQMEPIFPGITKQWNGKAMLSTPFTDPNFLCSYSYWKPGQYTGFSGYEKARQGNIHFAGEHCSINFQGFMEGGAAEGIRAANEILADLKKL